MPDEIVFVFFFSFLTIIFHNLVQQSKEAAAKIREIYNTVCLSDEVTPPIDPTDELLIAETFDEAADF